MSSTDRLPAEECLDYGRDECRGPVHYHSLDPGIRPAFPRCSRHWGRRLAEDERHRSDYPDSPIPPAWFDPSIAGETWDD